MPAAAAEPLGHGIGLKDANVHSDLLDALAGPAAARHGGWRSLPRAEWPRRARLPGRGLPKGEIWKDAAHETDFYLTAIQMLRGLSPAAPID